MKELLVASHTGFDGVELWVFCRAVDPSLKEEETKALADIEKALSGKIPKLPQYDRRNGTNFGPFSWCYDLSDAAYEVIKKKYPDGNIPADRWTDALGRLGITNKILSWRYQLEA